MYPVNNFSSPRPTNPAAGQTFESSISSKTIVVVALAALGFCMGKVAERANNPALALLLQTVSVGGGLSWLFSRIFSSSPGDFGGTSIHHHHYQGEGRTNYSPRSNPGSGWRLGPYINSFFYPSGDGYNSGRSQPPRVTRKKQGSSFSDVYRAERNIDGGYGPGGGQSLRSLNPTQPRATEVPPRPPAYNPQATYNPQARSFSSSHPQNGGAFPNVFVVEEKPPIGGSGRGLNPTANRH